MSFMDFKVTDDLQGKYEETCTGQNVRQETVFQSLLCFIFCIALGGSNGGVTWLHSQPLTVVMVGGDGMMIRVSYL
jgi:hypothetical protein